MIDFSPEGRLEDRQHKTRQTLEEAAAFLGSISAPGDDDDDNTPLTHSTGSDVRVIPMEEVPIGDSTAL